MVRRKLFNQLLDHLPKKEFTILTGARQTGKSTLLHQLEEHCLEEEVPTTFLNLENKATLMQLNESPLNIFKFLPKSEKRIVVFVDEIQYLDDPSNFIKLLYDEHAVQLKIVASGSSGFYLDNRFKDSLAGRKRIFQLLTCSFEEYLELNGKQILADEKKRLEQVPGARSTRIDYLRIEWENYLIFGGYPAVVTEPETAEKINRLKEIRDSFVKRDILESGVVNENTFYQLFRILASQTGGLVNINELSATLRIKNETTGNYLGILQKCFHIVLTKPFSHNLRKELVKMPKVYLLDTGIRNCLLNNFQQFYLREDKGELWENSLFRSLVDKYGAEELFFWRTSAGNEVDFVLPNLNEPKAYEAKFDIAFAKINKYKSFQISYPAIPLKFAWMYPLDEDFFDRMSKL